MSVIEVDQFNSSGDFNSPTEDFHFDVVADKPLCNTVPAVNEHEKVVEWVELRLCGVMEELTEAKKQHENIKKENLNQQKKHRSKKRINNTREKSSPNKPEPENDKVEPNYNNIEFLNKMKDKITLNNEEISKANRNVSLRGNAFGLELNNHDSGDGIHYIDAEESKDDQKRSAKFSHRSLKEQFEENVYRKSKLFDETSRVKHLKSYNDGGFVNCMKVSKSKLRTERGMKKRLFPKFSMKPIQRFQLRSLSTSNSESRKFGFGSYSEAKKQTLARSSSKPEFYRRNSRQPHCRKDSYETSAAMQSEVTSERENLRNDVLEDEEFIQNQNFPDEEMRVELKYIPKNSRSDKSDIVQRIESKWEEVDAVEAGKENVPQSNTSKSKVESVEPEGGKSTSFFKLALQNIVASNPDLGPILKKKTIPFVPCRSTSKSFNIGLNIQLVYSMIKSKQHHLNTNITKIGDNNQDESEPILNTLYRDRSSSHVSLGCPARHEADVCDFEFTDDSLPARGHFCNGCVSHDVTTEPRRPEDIWEPVKRERSFCTCYPSKKCIDYQKLLRQYTNPREWNLSKKKSSCVGKLGLPVNQLHSSPSRVRRHRSNPVQSFEFKSAAGSSSEVSRFQDDLMNLNRKYSTLEGNISRNYIDEYEAKAEVEAMESEMDVKEVEFKDMLTLYEQLLKLKGQLQVLKTQNLNKISIAQAQSRKPTNLSLEMTQVLRKIQSIQSRIKQDSFK